MGGGRDVFEIAAKTMKESCKKGNSTKDKQRWKNMRHKRSEKGIGELKRTGVWEMREVTVRCNEKIWKLANVAKKVRAVKTDKKAELLKTKELKKLKVRSPLSLCYPFHNRL
jgi:hypothetical protein